MTRGEFLERKREIKKAIEAKNILSDKARKQYADDALDFKFDLQLFGKGGGKKGKILFSILFAAIGVGIGLAVGLEGMALVNAGLIGASIGGTIWTATHKQSDKLNDTPSIQRFDKAQETMSSTGAIPVVYGTRKIAGNQTFHETNAEQNTLHKHVVLCEGGIDGIQSVCANDLLIPTGNQTAGTVFTLHNTLYKDARVWKDKKTLHLFCNGHDREIYLCNKDDAEKADTFYAWQTSIDSLISYINRLHEGWQAFPVATTTKYPGDLKVGAGFSSQGIITITPEEIGAYYKEHKDAARKLGVYRIGKGVPGGFVPYSVINRTGYFVSGDKLPMEGDAYAIVRDVTMPTPQPVTVTRNGRTYTYTPKLAPNTKPLSYQIEVYGYSQSNCYDSMVSITADTVTGGTNYTFHDCETPSNYEEVGGYPNMAWLDMTFKASEELNGGNPSVECIVRGKKVYDPRTGRTEYSENPALIVGDFLCNKRYGLGRWISADDLDIDSFVEAANYCDEEITVYDAYENQIRSKRYTLNMVIDQRQDAIKWLQEMLANFAGWLVISRNKIKLLVEKPSPVCYKFNDDNLKDMKVVPLKASDTPNHYQVSLCCPEENWKVISVISDDFADQKARGKVISKEVELSGVTSQAQALRLARFYSDYNLSCPLTLTFTTGIEAMGLECGDVVSVTYRDAFTNMPIRINTIRETSENEFEISGRQYNESIYGDDLGGGIQTPNYANNKGVDEDSDYFFIANVERLKAETLARKNLDGKTVYDISVTYKLPENYYIDSARVYYKTNSTSSDSNRNVFEEGVNADELGYISDWRFAGEGTSQVIISNAHVGDVYKIRVVSKTKKGKLGDIDSAPEVLCKVNPKSTVPAKPYNLRYNFSKEFRFEWEDVPDSDVIYYEVRTDANVGLTTGLMGRTTAPTIALKLTQRFGTIYVYAVNAQKKYSEPATVEYAYPKPDAPGNIEFYATPRGMRIIVPPFPDSCKSMNLYVTSEKVSEKLNSTDSTYTYTGEPGIYSLRVAYIDLIGEGYLSAEYSFTVEPTFKQEWIDDESLSLEKMDKTIQAAVTRAQSIDADLTKIETEQGKITSTVSKFKKDVNTRMETAEGKIDGAKADADAAKAAADEAQRGITGVASQITQTEDKITSVVTELGKDPSKCSYSAITQLLDGINLRVSKKDFTGKEIINQINMTAKGTTIDGQYLHVTGTTKFDKDVITGGMIKAGSITADKMASQMITLTNQNGLKGFTGGNVKLDSSGMTVTKNDGSAVLFNGAGMSFKNKNGGVFSALGAVMVGVAHDGQYVKFNTPWDYAPSVLITPVRLQTSVVGYDKQNIYQVIGATEVTRDGFRVNCRTVLGKGSGGSVPVNARFFSGDGYSSQFDDKTWKARHGWIGIGDTPNTTAICGEERTGRWCNEPYGNGHYTDRPFVFNGKSFYKYFIPDNRYVCFRTYTFKPPQEASKAYVTMSAYIQGCSTGIYGIHLQVSNDSGTKFITDSEVCRQGEGTMTVSRWVHKPDDHGYTEHDEYRVGARDNNVSGTFEVNFRKGGSIIFEAALYCYSFCGNGHFNFYCQVDSIAYNTDVDQVVSQGDAQFIVLDQANKLYTVN